MRLSVRCPRCGQAWLDSMATTSGETFVMCRECDATWGDGTEFPLDAFVMFDDWLEVRGLGYRDVAPIGE